MLNIKWSEKHVTKVNILGYNSLLKIKYCPKNRVLMRINSKE